VSGLRFLDFQALAFRFRFVQVLGLRFSVFGSRCIVLGFVL